MPSAVSARVERRTRFAVAFLAACTSVRVARAQTATDVEPVHVTYTAPLECPAERDFFDAVRARTPRVRRARDDEIARTFSVAVERTDAGYRARLEIVDAAGAVNRRDVDDVACAEAVSAVALVAALSVDPSAAASTSAAAPVDAKPAPTTALPPPIVAREPALPAAASASPEPEPAPTSSPPVRYRWSAGAAAEALAFVVSDVAFGGGIHADLTPTRGTFVPSFRLTAHAVTTRVSRSGITADLTWWLARGELCPLRTSAATLVVEACGVIDGGALTTSGGGVDRPGRGARAWGAAGLAPRLRWFATPGVEVFFESILELPFKNYTLTYVASTGQTTELIQMSPVSMDLVLGAAYRFP